MSRLTAFLPVDELSLKSSLSRLHNPGFLVAASKLDLLALNPQNKNLQNGTTRESETYFGYVLGSSTLYTLNSKL